MILKIEQIREKHIKIQCDFHRKPIGWEGLRATSVRKKYRRKISIFIRSKFEVKKQKEHLKIFNPINSYEFHSRKAEAPYSTFLLCLHTTCWVVYWLELSSVCRRNLQIYDAVNEIERFPETQRKGQHSSTDYNCTMSLARDPTTSDIFLYSMVMGKITLLNLKYKTYLVSLSAELHTQN